MNKQQIITKGKNPPGECFNGVMFPLLLFAINGVVFYYKTYYLMVSKMVICDCLDSDFSLTVKLCEFFFLSL